MPDDECDMKFTEEIDQQLCARTLTELGGRPTMVAALSGIKTLDAIRLFADVHAHAPPRGMLPTSQEWYFVTRARRRDAAILLAIYVEALRCAPRENKAARIIAAWRLFVEISPRTLFDINRAWGLISAFEADQIKLIRVSERELPFYNNYDIE